ncbi:hypothetical protein ACVIQY_007129 [Bradyrhizobium sp. USDA 3051]
MNNTLAIARAHDGERHQMMRIAADAGAEVEDDGIAAPGRPHAGNGRTVDARQRAQVEARHRHQRPGIPGGDRNIRLALFHRIDGKPHGRGPAAAPQRLARLFLAADRDIGVDDLRGRLQRGVAVELGFDLGAVPDQQEFDLAMPLERDGGAWDDHRGAGVAPHGVKRDANLAWHKSPGNLGLVRS